MGDTLSVRAHANVALVKYWGKSNEKDNLPATGSLSIGLSGLTTTTLLTAMGAGHTDRVSLNGETTGAGVERIQTFLERARRIYPGIGPVDVASSNDFPTGAGLASSASGFAALAIGVNERFELGLDRSDVSRLARLGSGSASRSVFGGFVVMDLAGGGAARAIDLEPGQWPLTVLVAVTDTSQKSVGSTEAMRRTAQSSPFYSTWVERHPIDMGEAFSAIERSDFDVLAAVSIRSCLNMHATIMSARPPIVYWNAGTLSVMQTVEHWRDLGRKVFYTIDAGPQVKVICHQDDVAACRSELLDVAGVREVVESGVGGEPSVQWL